MTNADEFISHLLTRLPAILDEAVAVCEVPAPPFAEEKRADYVAQRVTQLGLGAPARDPAGNVTCVLPGAPGRRRVLLSAHLDTVFPAETSLRVRRDGNWLYGPGIGDNSLGLAAMLWLGRALRDLPDRGDLVLAANVGEEGIGDLRGAKALWQTHGRDAGAWIILEGASFNQGALGGTGSRRYRVTYRTQAGHSWRDFGKPSAIHALGRLIDQISHVDVPRSPKTTFNVGVIEGGTSVNTIAPSASLLLDMRSDDTPALKRLEHAALALVTSIADASGVTAETELIGDRPGGRLAPDHWLVARANEIARGIGQTIEWGSHSTDANVPLSQGAAAITLGLARGEHIHAAEEKVDVSVLPDGLRQVGLLLASLLRDEWHAR
ncbi:MAG: M20/M25/M40 family metallo-hydrolase [Armatimonadetes bacterium]|nr:M20/M25/M40 family metallo-hydrolase [Armatimonadota bacterium]